VFDQRFLGAHPVKAKRLRYLHAVRSKRPIKNGAVKRRFDLQVAIERYTQFTSS
jgi:hypothetical protein